MATQSTPYDITSGDNRFFASTKPIASKSHVAVWLSLDGITYSEVTQNDYELINDTIVFASAPTGNKIELRVADTPDELLDSPTDISIVAGISDDVTTTANISEEIIAIAEDLDLLIATAEESQLSAWEAEAEEKTAESFASEAIDTFVKRYTSDGDGSFTATDTVFYSAYHYANETAVKSGIVNDNLIINGSMLINQRSFDGVSWVDGQYAYDRWKATATAMTQIVEDGSYEYNTTYTLSGTNVTTQQVSSPASGHWTLPEIPRTSTSVKLEKGSVATPYQPMSIGKEVTLCQRYYLSGNYNRVPAIRYVSNFWTISAGSDIPVTMRTSPTVVHTATTLLGQTIASSDAVGPTTYCLALRIESVDAATADVTYAIGSYTADAEI